MNWNWGSLIFHWDVLKEYLKLVHPKYHHGCDVDIEQDFPQDIYNHPHYFDDADVKEETKKYFMKTDGDLSRIQYNLSKYNRKALEVIYFNCIQLQFNCNTNEYYEETFFL